jgi:hypothetical protein
MGMKNNQALEKRRRVPSATIPFYRRRRWQAIGILIALCVTGLAVWGIASGAQAPREAPEAAQVLAVQARMPFQVIIPAYMPPDFDRAGVEIKIDQTGPSGEPMVQLGYRTRSGATLFAREWVPLHPEKEILAASRPIQTKWGRGWLLVQSDSLIALWVDVGPLRISLYTSSVYAITKEQILQMAETLGPASNQVVFSFVVDQPVVREMAPPEPVEIQINGQGVQEVNLIVTPGGYSPLRFAVRKGVRVRLTFRQLGQVGCGNELIFPANPDSPSSLRLTSEHDKQVLEFMPQQAGQFEFYCSHRMYRGVMTVRD